MITRLLQTTILLIVTTGVFSQTALTIEDFPYAGLEVEYMEIQINGNSDSLVFGSGGDGDDFDFSYLGTILADTLSNVDTVALNYISPDEIALDGVPAEANVAVFSFEMDSSETDTILWVYDLYNSSNGVFEALGFIGVADLSAVFGGPVSGNLDTVPFISYNSDTLFDVKYELGFSAALSAGTRAQLNDTMLMAEANDWILSVDAFGTLVTPIGTYNDVYRISRYGSIYDSIFVNGTLVDDNLDTNAVYEYFAKGYGHPIVRCELSTDFSTAYKVEMLSTSNWQSSILSNPEIAQLPELKVYPNPGTGQLSLNFDLDNAGDHRMVIYNQIGQSVATYEAAELNQSGSIDISHLENGSYMIIIQDSKGSIKAVEQYLKVGNSAR